MWIDNQIRDLTAKNLDLLITSKIPALEIPVFATAHECEQLKQALLSESCRGSSVPEVTRLGISQYQHGVRESKAYYLALAERASTLQSEIFAQSFDPNSRLISIFRGMGRDMDIMQENGKTYFAGCGKVRTGVSPIHVDFAPQDSKDWGIGQAEVQLAWNLYLDTGSLPGDLILWDKMWQPEDDKYQVEDNYYYDKRIVSDLPENRFPVTVGSVILINARNFHAVSDAKDRVTFGSFISVFEDGSMRLFS